MSTLITTHTAVCRHISSIGCRVYYPILLTPWSNTMDFLLKFRTSAVRSQGVRIFNSFGTRFQTTLVDCVFILTNYRLERRLYVKLKNWMSNSIDPDETAHLDLCCLQKPNIIACGSERVKMNSIHTFTVRISSLSYVFWCIQFYNGCKFHFLQDGICAKQKLR